MLARLLVQYHHQLPTRQLHAWLRHIDPKCTGVKLNPDGHAVLVAGEHKLKVLSDGAVLKRLSTAPAKMSVPLLYELCTTLDLQDETSTLLCRSLEKVVDIGIGKNYVRWYGSTPRRLAINTDADVMKHHLDVGHRHGVDFYQTKPPEWTVLWRFTTQLRRLLADHLEELLTCQPFQP